VGLSTQKWNLQTCEHGNQRLGNAIRVASIGVGRLHFTQGGRDFRQAMPVPTHEPEPTDKYITVHSQGVDEVRKVFSLHHTNILQPGNGVVSELECFVFDSGDRDAIFSGDLDRELQAFDVKVL